MCYAREAIAYRLGLWVEPDFIYRIVCTYLKKRLLLKELWMFYIIQGEFYEAYHLYKDDIQRVRLLITSDKSCNSRSNIH